MQLILFTNDRGQIGQFSLRSARTLTVVISCGLLLSSGIFFGGLKAASVFGIGGPESQQARIEQWRSELNRQEDEIEQTRQQLERDVDALALRLGQLNAHIVRLDALGSRLTKMAGLDEGEFDFTAAPPLGGPEELVAVTEGSSRQMMDSAIDALEAQINDRSQQLSVIEDFLMNRKLHDEVHPEGRPVSSGYVSSRFGTRNDPFTGRRAFHKGIDFAGREGAEVTAVASGVVTWSGDRYGYGQMVELNHGNGYVTRYAHNAENLVNVGDMVKRGDIIARMGDTGRATGPNLHFEVLVNGSAVNPLSYID